MKPLATVRLARREGEGVWNSLLAISWFWFIGAVVLSQISAIGKDVLHGDTSVVTVMLATFSIGVTIGSLLCERLSGHQVEIGLVPLGSLGLSLLTADLALAAVKFSTAYAAVGGEAVLTWSQFLATSASWRVLFDIGLLGVFGGLFIVPLYAFIQLRTALQRQSRVISANNILNVLFMVSAAGMSVALLFAGLSVTGLILVCAGLNALVAAYIFRTVPEFLWRFVSWVIRHSLYRLKIERHENVPEQGAAIIAPNHGSYVYTFVLSAISPRPIRYVLDSGALNRPMRAWLFRLVKAIPIASANDDPAVHAAAFESIRHALNNGELVCFLPAGTLTGSGNFGEFKAEIRQILDVCPVAVVPVDIDGIGGSEFTRNGQPLLQRIFCSLSGRRVTVKVENPLTAEAFCEYCR